MKILITGGSGFIGSHVSDILSKNGHQIINLDIKIPKWKKKKQNFIKGKTNNLILLKKILKKIDVVYHFAGFSNLSIAKSYPIETIKNNILDTMNLLKISNETGVKKFIFASSIYATSKQGSFYSCSKRAAEDYIIEYCKSIKLKFVILRFGTIFGPRSDLNNGVKKIIHNALVNKKIEYQGTKNASREYIHVLDAAKGCFEVLKKKYDNKIIRITGKKNIKVLTLLKFLQNYLKIKKLKFLNKKNTGHYDIAPKKYSLRKDKKIFYKKNINFKKSITSLIKETNIDSTII